MYYTRVNDRLEDTEHSYCTYSKSGVVGVFELEELHCDETVFVIIRSAGTDILRANSLVAAVVTRDFRCLLHEWNRLVNPVTFNTTEELRTPTKSDLLITEQRLHVY